MNAFWLAVQFLTRLPVPAGPENTEEDQGRALLFYPVVGLVIGTLLSFAQQLFSGADHLLAAALVLAVWVLVTGGLHLDGLADSADAWLGGHGDRERTLAIMKDPASGPAGVMLLVLVLLLKFTALAAVTAADSLAPLMLAPVLGRAALLPLFVTTPYVRPGGLGEALSRHASQNGVRIALILVALLALFAGLAGLLMLLAAALMYLWLRWLMMERIGGTTGDTAGALVELVETAVLVAAALVVG